MQCGLVGYGALDEGGAVALVAEAQSVKPGRPSGIEVAFDTDLVPSEVVMVTGRCFAHDAPSGVARLDGSLSPSAGPSYVSQQDEPELRAIRWLDRKVEADVMRGHRYVCRLM